MMTKYLFNHLPGNVSGKNRKTIVAKTIIQIIISISHFRNKHKVQDQGCNLDQFIGALTSVAERAKAGDPSLKPAPHFAPRARLDETLAARSPKLVWKDA
jgi:glycine cleavage system protein P-like pyridoxal-binding family